MLEVNFVDKKMVIFHRNHPYFLSVIAIIIDNIFDMEVMGHNQLSLNYSFEPEFEVRKVSVINSYELVKLFPADAIETSIFIVLLEKQHVLIATLFYQPLGLEISVIFNQTVLFAVWKDHLAALVVDHYFVVGIKVMSIVNRNFRFHLLSVVNFVGSSPQIKVFLEVKGADLLESFPLTGYKALVLLVTWRLKIDIANIVVLSGTNRFNFIFLCHDVQNEDLMASISDQEPILLVKHKILNETEIDI